MVYSCTVDGYDIVNFISSSDESITILPDREHLHHLIQRNGLNRVQTLLIICSLAIMFSLVGLLGEIYQVPEYAMFVGFVFMLYAL